MRLVLRPYGWHAQAQRPGGPVLRRDGQRDDLRSRFAGVSDAAGNASGHLYYVDAVRAPNPANPFVPRQVDSYFRLDLRGEYEFRDDQASIAVGVRNLLDSNHYEGGTLFLNDAEVPRMIFAELRLSMK